MISGSKRSVPPPAMTPPSITPRACSEPASTEPSYADQVLSVPCERLARTVARASTSATNERTTPMQMNENARAVAMMAIACTMTVLFWHWSEGSLWSLAWLALAARSYFA